MIGVMPAPISAIETPPPRAASSLVAPPPQRARRRASLALTAAGLIGAAACAGPTAPAVPVVCSEIHPTGAPAAAGPDAAGTPAVPAADSSQPGLAPALAMKD